MKFTFSAHRQLFTFSDEHPRSRNGVPVLLTDIGTELRPWDQFYFSHAATCPARDVVWLLRVLKPRGSAQPFTADPRILAMVEAYEAVPAG